MTTWSISRDQILHWCERRYFFQYLASARINSRNEHLRKIAFYKKLSNIPMWKGNIFHNAAALVLQNARKKDDLNEQCIKDSVIEEMRNEWVYSSSLTFRQNTRAMGKPGNLALFEHEYGQVANIDLEVHIEDVLIWLSHFGRWIREGDLVKDIVNAQRIWIEPRPFGPAAPGFYTDDTQVITKVDLAIQDKQGFFDVYDWKTGVPPQISSGSFIHSEFQVSVYLLWPILTLNIPMNMAKGHLVYLGDEFAQFSFTLDKNQRESTLALANHSISRVKHFEELRKDAGMEIDDLDFALQEWACKTCNFKRFCQDAIANE